MVQIKANEDDMIIITKEHILLENICRDLIIHQKKYDW